MKILLPFDGSRAATGAVQTVVTMAREGMSLQLVLANVQEPASLYELVVAHDPKVIQEVSQAAGHHILQPAQKLLKAAGLTYDLEVRSGDPAHTLIDILQSHGCQMVVMGSNGASALRSAMLGSVSNEVLHSAGVPVVIVKHAEADLAADT